MPIDPKKLAALQGAVKPPKGRRFGVEGADAKKPKKDVLEEGDPDDEGLDEEDDEFGEPDPSQVLPFLEQYAEEIQTCIDEVDQDTLIDPEMPLSADAVTILQEGALMLPPRLQRLLPNLADITFEDAGVLAAALVERQKFDDPETVAGWIFRIGQVLAGEYEEGGEDDLDEDDEDLEEP